MKLKIGKELRGIIVRSAAALISLIMTVSLLPLTLLASVNVPNVNSDGFYEIGTADELFWFAEQVNSGNTSVSAALTGDIDLGGKAWTPIGGGEWAFSGTFDGNGHTVAGLSVTADGDLSGMFGKCVGAVIQNFSVYGNITASSSLTAAGTVGAADDTVISGVISGVNISCAEGILLHRVGGIVGSIENGKTTVSGCVFNGSISADASTDSIGGIVGYSNGAGSITQCLNNGTLTADAEDAYVGGILGYTDNAGFGGLTYCVNSGKINASGSYYGAIIGFAKDHDYSMSVHDNYYLDTSCGRAFGAGSSAAPGMALAKTQADFENGTIDKLIGSGSAGFGSVMNPGKPTGYNANDSSNPYQMPEDHSFLLAEHNELYLYYSYDDKRFQYIYDGYNPGEISLKDKYYWGSGISSSSASQKSTDPAFFTQNMEYIRAVSFDAAGTGRKTHIAFVGIYTGNDSAYRRHGIYYWILDTRNNSASGFNCIDGYGDASWIGSNTKDYPHFMENYLSVTAGDYDGDGKDTAVIYLGGNGKNKALFELSLVGNSRVTYTKVADIAPLLRYSEYESSASIEKQPIVHLATGDFDGDGRDELAAAAGFANFTGQAKDGTGSGGMTVNDIAAFTTGVTVFEKGGGWAKLGDTSYLYTAGDKISSSGGVTKQKYQFIHQGSIAAGDIDGDGVDEMVVAGYTTYMNDANYIQTSGSEVRGYKIFDLDKEKYAYSTLYYDGKGIVHTDVATVAINSFSKENFRHDSDSIHPAIAMACAKINGANASAAVFIAGDIYDFSQKAANKAYTPRVINAIFSTLMDGNTRADLSWVSNVTAGNFDANSLGREQFVYTLAFKERSSHNSAYYVGIVGGTEYDSNNAATAYYNSDVRGKSGASMTESDGSSLFYRKSGKLSCVVVAIDNDEDGVKARYSGKEYAYSDPEVVALLQAAPYFSELGSYASNNTGTTYEVSTSYEIGHGTSNSVSFGIGFAGQLDLKVFEGSLELGYTLDWEESWEESVTTSWTHSFTAGSEDQILVSRTPVTVYRYDVYDAATGTWKPDSVRISVPGDPVISQLSVGEYNDFARAYNRLFDTSCVLDEISEDDFADYASYTEAYNAALDKADIPEIKNKATGKDEDSWKPVLLRMITDEMLPYGASGDPYAYRDTWNLLNGESLSLATAALSYAGGSSSLAWSLENAENHSVSMAHGFHFSFQALFGTDTAKGGFYLELDYSHGKSSYTTKTYSKGASAEVDNIDIAAIQDELGLPENVIRSYGFNWEFGVWDAHLTTDGKAYPVYGFRVFNLTAPTPPVTDLELTVNGDSFELSWSKPYTAFGRTEIIGYFVYRVDEDGGYTRISGLISNPSYITDFEPGMLYRYVVTTVGRSGGVQLESPWSNCVGYRTGVQAGKSAYELAVENGYTGSLSEWLDSLVGKTGENGKSAYELAVENGYTGSLSDWLASLAGENGEAGRNGENGKSAYELAVENGFEGSLSDWLTSLIGKNGTDGKDGENGKSAYEIALGNGFSGTEADWLASLIGNRGESGKSAYEIACERGFEGSEEEWLLSLIGRQGEKGADGTGIEKIELTLDGKLVIILTNGETVDLGYVIGKDGADGKNGQNGTDGRDGLNGKDGADGKSGTDGKTPYVGPNGNWWVGNTDTGITVKRDGTQSALPSGGNSGGTPEQGTQNSGSADTSPSSDRNYVGVKDIRIDENGNLIFTMEDGSVINAGKAEASVPASAQADRLSEMQSQINALQTKLDSGSTSGNTCTVAYIALIISVISLIWNAVSLIVGLTKLKKTQNRFA